jgi:hypothetical protein
MNRLNEILSDLADELGVPQENPGREAFWQRVADGEEQGPELSMGMSYPDAAPQRAYDIGTWIGAAIWGAKLEEAK